MESIISNTEIKIEPKYTINDCDTTYCSDHDDIFDETQTVTCKTEPETTNDYYCGDLNIKSEEHAHGNGINNNESLLDVKSETNELQSEIMIKEESSDKDISSLTKDSRKSKNYCQFCPKIFASYRDVINHLQKKHKNTERMRNLLYSCDTCKYTTIRYPDLRKHLVTHGYKEGVQSFKCDKCEYKSYHKSNFIAHIRTHKQVKKILCSTCNKGFNRKSGLDGHILQKHRDDKALVATITSKLYKCTKCPSVFIKTTHLASHNYYNHTK